MGLSARVTRRSCWSLLWGDRHASQGDPAGAFYGVIGMAASQGDPYDGEEGGVSEDAPAVVGVRGSFGAKEQPVIVSCR